MEKPNSSKDYKEFKKFIAKKHKYLKDHFRRMAKQQGYHSVNALTTGVNTEEIAEVLDNLAMTKTTEKSTIKDVQATNQQLLDLMQKMMEKMDWMKEDLVVASLVEVAEEDGDTMDEGEEVMEDTVEQGKRIQRVNDW
eukprot:7968760-Ditylum_brightwellii.AAC.1